MSDVDMLRANYPDLYPEEIEVWYPPGWTAIVERMSAALIGKRVEIRSVRDKYGWLIVQHYEDATDADAIAIIKAATDASEVTCAQCGGPGVMREDDAGMTVVRCNEHAEGAEPISMRYADVLAAGRHIAERDAEALRRLAE